jgi:hypothetical protein
VLAYPGDPGRAIGETAACRCTLAFVWEVGWAL